MAVRRVTATIVLAAFVAFATGLTLAVHLHEADAGHEPRQCDLCQLMTSGVIAPVDGPTAIVADGQIDYQLQPLIEPEVSIDHAFAPIAPRAPPAC